MSHKRWKLLRAASQTLTPPRPCRGVPSGAAGWLAAQLLANRGISGDIEAFLSGSPGLAGDPFMLPEMGVAVTRIKWAVRQEQPIAVYGDFDADGVTATVLLTEGLTRLGAKVVPYIPHRFVEGYGLNQPALERLGAQGARLVVTADTGTTALSEIAWAESQGLDIVVTDHHTPAATLPPALATINPRRAGSLYPFTELAGVGVALKLLQALGMDTATVHDSGGGSRHGGTPTAFDPSAGSGLDLVALGTVADMMPLLGENRYLVHRGLDALKRNPRLGLRCLMAGAGLEPGQVDTETISFCLAPRLNAAGRLDHAMRSYSLLTATQKPEAERCAAALDALNKERQRRTGEVCRRAQEILAAQVGATDVAAIQESPLPPLIMLGDPSFDSGVLGISANHLADQLYRPVVLYRQGAELCRGSARSIPEFNVVAALAHPEVSRWLLRYGGHPGAAGFTARPEHMSDIKLKLVETAARELAGVELRPRLNIDAEVRLADLNGELLPFISRLAPYGPGNPPPTFLTRRVEVLEARLIGANGKHLRLKLRETGGDTAKGGVVWDGIAFDLTQRHALPSGLLDVVYTLGVNSWQGQEYLELRLLDFAPTGAVAV
ncbi:MAG: single-stranded-DNA-specific exonuclease RecJ [Chloroflexi bacterium]|nr:single-stranded-DNA-specific exonuclease RecJ [Chloroflexota bacterium]